MSKKTGTQFSLNGFQKNQDGTYSKIPTQVQPRDKALGKTMDQVLKEQTYSNPLVQRSDTHKYTGSSQIPQGTYELNLPKYIQKSVITIPGIVDGLNGDEGLMRGHWTKIKKVKELFITIIYDHLASGKAFKHPGKVKIKYVGYKSVLMDWDNFCASFKHIGDSLVKTGVITEDRPAIVTQFLPDQVKCKRINQCVVIIIEDVI